MQNGTGWKSALIWGFRAQLPRLEKLVTFSFWIWGPSVLGTCPVAPYLILLWIYAEWDWVKNLHKLGDSPHSCLGCRSQSLIRFTFEPLPFRALTLFPTVWFYCRSMQNGTVWRSAQIWGFSAQLPGLEKLFTYSFWIWGPSIDGTCPVAPYLIVLWIYAEWHWMKICTNVGIPCTVV